jgi:catechol 2,3-dioxygenase-like lactoylglutathione lyase family enzyme
MPSFGPHHVGLSVGDLDQQVDFYCRAFELEPESTSSFPDLGMRTAIVANRSGLRVELTERLDSRAGAGRTPYEAAAVQGYFHLAIAVDDLDAAYRHAASAGARPVSGPAAASRPGVTFAYLADPEENLIELIHTLGENNIGFG